MFLNKFLLQDGQLRSKRVVTLNNTDVLVVFAVFYLINKTMG